MKTETIKEIGKRLGEQKVNKYNFYNYKKGNLKDGVLKKLISELTNREK